MPEMKAPVAGPYTGGTELHGPFSLDSVRNLLAGLIGLMRMGDFRRAEETLGHVGGLLRSLDAAAQTAALRDECRVVEDYLALQMLRFGQRLTYRITTDEDLAGVNVRRNILLHAVGDAVTRWVDEAGLAVHLDIRFRHRDSGKSRTTAILKLSRLQEGCRRNP